MPDAERPIEVAEEWDLTEVPRMSEDELRILAQRVIKNEVFLTNKEPGIAAFRAVLGMAIPKMKEEYVLTIGGIWEEFAKAGPRSVNGLPFFFSMHLVAIQDWDILMGFIRDMERAMGLPVMPGEHDES